MKRLLATVIVAVAAAAGIGFAAQPAAAASISCNSTVKAGIPPEFSPFTEASVPSANGSRNCVLGVGNQSSAVSALQTTLNRCYSAGLKVDGKYGSRTAAAVRKAQGKIGVKADGVYGPKTRAKLKFAVWDWFSQTWAGCAVVG